MLLMVNFRPQSGVGFSQYYKDGTIHPGPQVPLKNILSNGQVVIAAIVFAFVGALVQLFVVT